MNDGFAIRKDFPLLRRMIHGHQLIYLDNAATTAKPQAMLDTLLDFYCNYGANVYRAVYTLAEETTALFDTARMDVAHFIGARPHEIIFTKGATESINAVAFSWALQQLGAGDQIVVTALEHHSNLVPWQECALRTGCSLKIIPVHSDGTLQLESLEGIVGNNTKLVAVSHVSNVLGTINDISILSSVAHKVGAKILVDASQSIAHQSIDVHTLQADFLVFSGHKIMGPTGIGVLYVNEDLFGQIKPYQYGGGMVAHVQSDRASWQNMPTRLEAGTPPIAQAIGLSAALKYMKTYIEYEQLKKHEATLCKTLIEGLSNLDKVTVYGPVDQLKESGHIVSFNIDGWHPHDVASWCDRYGICVRAGVHCAHPLAAALGIGPSVRISTFAYNTTEDIEQLLSVLSMLVQ